jgi:hypothetical protein
VAVVVARHVGKQLALPFGRFRHLLHPDRLS